ncbi:hypothetical protein [Streptomyces echinatus]
MGPSGSGKTTLLHCLAGMDRPTRGSSGGAAPRCPGCPSGAWRNCGAAGPGSRRLPSATGDAGPPTAARGRAVRPRAATGRLRCRTERRSGRFRRGADGRRRG